MFSLPLFFPATYDRYLWSFIHTEGSGYPHPGWSSAGWKGFIPQLSNSFSPAPPWETLAHFQITLCKLLSLQLPNLIQSNPSGSVKPKSNAPTQARELATPAPSTVLTPPSYQRSPAPQSSQFNWWVWGFLNNSNCRGFLVFLMQYSDKKKPSQTRNEGRRMISGQGLERASL